MHEGKEAKQLEAIRMSKHVVSLFIIARIVKAQKLYVHQINPPFTLRHFNLFP